MSTPICTNIKIDLVNDATLQCSSGNHGGCSLTHETVPNLFGIKATPYWQQQSGQMVLIKCHWHDGLSFRKKNCILANSIYDNDDCSPNKTPISCKLRANLTNINRIFALCLKHKSFLSVCCFCVTLSVREVSMEGKWRFLPPEQGRAPAGTQHASCAPLVKSCWWISSISTTMARSSAGDTTLSF